MDFLDIMNGRYYHTQAGGLYKTLPTATYTVDDETVHKARIPIDYETVNMQEWRYQQILRNLVGTDAGVTAIKTRIDYGFAVGQHVALWDGGLYRITGVMRDTSGATPESFYVLPTPLGTEYILTLTQVENAWGLI